MAFDARVLQVMIASPSDTASERDAVERALHSWNTDRARREQVILLPRRWETAAVPRLGDRPQGIINKQLVDESDIVVAIFDSRLGLATGEAVSGTAEEIERAHAAGKPVHVWFSTEPLPRDANLEQVQALRDFRRQLWETGLLRDYSDPADLANKVRQAVESDLEELGLGPVVGRRSGEPGAVLRARYESDRDSHVDSKGVVHDRTRRRRITVSNTGTTTAGGVRLDLQVDGEADPPELWGDEKPDILGGSEFSWPIITSLSSARAFKVVMTWREGDQERSEVQYLSL